MDRTIVAMRDCVDLRRTEIIDSLLGISAAPRVKDEIMGAGGLLHRIGRPEEALSMFEWLTEQHPGDVNGWMAVAALRAELDRPWAALLACNKGLELSPEAPEVLTNTASILLRIGDLAAAEFVARKAINLAKGDGRPQLVLAKILAKMQRLSESAECYEAYLASEPLDMEARVEWADALVAQGEYADARKILESVLEKDSGMTAALILMSYLEAATGNDARANDLLAIVGARDPQALARWRPFLHSDFRAKVAKLDPMRFRMTVETAAVFECDWLRREGFSRWLIDVLEGERRASIDDEDAPFVALGLDIPPSARLKMANQVAARKAASVSGFAVQRRPRNKHGRLRIGYLTGDMRTHPIGRLFSPVFALHDRSRFEVCVYHTGPKEDCDPRRRAECDTDVFHDAEGLPPAALAQLIAADGVDILVDLSGYTLFSANSALALRPAPVQVHYLGFLGTLGAPYVDYSIADRYVLPDEIRGYWSESIAFLPETMIVCDGDMVASSSGMSRRDHGLPEDGFVFACLNATWKIEPDVFEAWARILEAVPGSVLWVFDGGLPRARENLLRHCERISVAASRLVFAEHVTYENYLERYRHVDLVLNTRTYSGNTTTLEALANNVPVLSFAGREMQSRLAAGIVRTIGVDSLVASTLQDYERMAVSLAVNPDQLEAIRRSIDEGGRSSGLYRIDRRVREIEFAYESMWQRHQSGQLPADIDVPRQL